MRKIVLTFGLIAGAILSGMMLLTVQLMDRIGFEAGEVIGYTTMIVAFLMIYFGIRAYRDNVAGGAVTFGRAFKVGALIWLVSATCYVATWQVLSRTAMQDFFPKYVAHQVDKARAKGESEEQIAERRATLEKYAEMYKNPLVNIAFTFVEPLPVGLIVTLVSAGVLSRRRSNP